MRTLAAHGYATGVYNPFVVRRFDDRAFELLGFQRRLAVMKSTGYIPSEFSERWSLDLDALRLMTNDMDRWEAEGQRFAVAFLPECGHFPLPPRPAGEPDSVLERGRAAIGRQDVFLKELLRVLEAHHRLDRTLIVITGDHGVRTSYEDRSLPNGMIDSYSFHVPLLIYAPQALTHPQTVPWITSHIDVQPTLLDLLGIPRQRNYEQGSPLWDSRLQARTTFFFGNHYCGADAYYANGKFFMTSEVFGTVYQNDRLQYTDDDLVPPSSPLHDEVTKTLRRMVGLQEAWNATLGKPVQQGNQQ
jgi:arylsulfatase A-like enzyme